MLLELRVENYAVIDNIAVQFAPGLNLLTGETGSGKSILVDALSLLLGEKASSDVVRHGAEKAVVSCVFDAAGLPAIEKLLEDNGIDSDSDDLILRREISGAGKGRVFINNQPATLAVLKQLGPHLASIHAQSEAILGFDGPARLSLLDSYAQIEPMPLRGEFERWQGLKLRIADLEQDERERLRLIDLWSFQRDEIEAAHLRAGEDQEWEAQKRILANAEKLYVAAHAVYEALYDAEQSAMARLSAAAKQMDELARFDPKMQDAVALLASARANVEEVSSTARAYAEGIDASPEKLAAVEDRLAQLDKLKRKYGKTLDEIIRSKDELAAKLDEIENRDAVLAALRVQLAAAADEYLRAARKLSQKRRSVAEKLQRLVESEINSLAMNARFKIEVTAAEPDPNWSPTGFDTARYMIATNPGEPMKPAEEIASGGELSRVMLALKATIFADATSSKGNGKGQSAKALAADPVQKTMVFDEIDTGIGGSAAEAVGRKLKSLAGSNQVLCVTHLAQIASFADHHYVIEKKVTAGRTRTEVRKVEGAERREEIARMISGAELTESSRRHAREMLKVNN